MTHNGFTPGEKQSAVFKTSGNNKYYLILNDRK
ncbi:hypothetical protein X965_18620 [Morganella sp. EGD-HP17]|nr:hypothetical protein X965_18620 [Morganella sp. EGD-HP17]